MKYVLLKSFSSLSRYFFLISCLLNSYSSLDYIAPNKWLHYLCRSIFLRSNTDANHDCDRLLSHQKDLDGNFLFSFLLKRFHDECNKRKYFAFHLIVVIFFPPTIGLRRKRKNTSKEDKPIHTEYSVYIYSFRENHIMLNALILMYKVPLENEDL